MSTPEGRIARSIMDWLRSLEDTLAWKVTDLNNVGFPDIVGVYKGIAFFFEVKSKNGRLSKKQEYEMARIKKVGGLIAEVKTLKEAKEYMIKWFGIKEKI